MQVGNTGDNIDDKSFYVREQGKLSVSCWHIPCVHDVPDLPYNDQPAGRSHPFVVWPPVHISTVVYGYGDIGAVTGLHQINGRSVPLDGMAVNNTL